MKKRPKAIVDAKTCMIDDIISSEVKVSLRRHGAPEEVHHQKLEAPCGTVFDLKEENTKIYNKLVEEVWRSEWEEDFFVAHQSKKEASQFKIQSEKVVAKKLRHNSKLWCDAYGKICNTYVEPLPYHKIWHRKFESYWPVYYRDQTSLNSLRNESILVAHRTNPTIPEVIDQVGLPGDVLDLISHFLRLLQHETWDTLVTIKPDDETLTHSVLSYHLTRYFPVIEHGVREVKRIIPIEEITYKNPFLGGQLTYSNAAYHYARVEELARADLFERKTISLRAAFRDWGY
jgi:hypothetical protein